MGNHMSVDNLIKLTFEQYWQKYCISILKFFDVIEVEPWPLQLAQIDM